MKDVVVVPLHNRCSTVLHYSCEISQIIQENRACQKISPQKVSDPSKTNKQTKEKKRTSENVGVGQGTMAIDAWCNYIWRHVQNIKAQKPRVGPSKQVHQNILGSKSLLRSRVLFLLL